MAKEAEEYPENNHIVTLPNLRCAQCLYFKDHAIYSDKCINLGILEKARPCNKFTANVKLLDKSKSIREKLYDIIGEMSKTQVELLASVLAKEATTRGNGLKFNQIVYVRKFGDDYISNYVKARVLSVSFGNVYVRGMDSDEFFGIFKKESIFNEEKFAAKKKELILLNKWRDPKLKNYTTHVMPTKTKKIVIDYEPPNIDNEPRPKSRKKSKAELNIIRLR